MFSDFIRGQSGNQDQLITLLDSSGFAVSEILGYDSEAFAEIKYKSLNCAKNFNLKGIGKALEHLENKLRYSIEDVSFHYLESLLFVWKAEAYKESACFGGLVEQKFKQFSKIMKLFFRQLTFSKHI